MINSTQDLIPHVASVATALPVNYVDQQTLTSALREFWADKCGNLELFDRLHKATKVSGRYLALPMSEYPELTSFARSNSAWMRVAPELGAQAARRALCDAGLEPTDINHFVFVTGTGIATPSIDTRIIGALGMREDVKRTPIFGLGCAGGAAGIAHPAARRLVDRQPYRIGTVRRRRRGRHSRGRRMRRQRRSARDSQPLDSVSAHRIRDGLGGNRQRLQDRDVAGDSESRAAPSAAECRLLPRRTSTRSFPNPAMDRTYRRTQGAALDGGSA